MPDLFLSYAHVDKHWVDTFAPLLEQRVNQYVGRSKPDRLWKDNRLTGNQPFSPEIHSQLNTAHCLIACISTGYFASEWCMRELTEFSRSIGNQTGRIFCIELDELALHQKPALTTHMLGYPFWRQDNLSKRSYPLFPGEPAYENLLIDLAKDIAGTLKAPSQPFIDKNFDKKETIKAKGAIETSTANHPSTSGRGAGGEGSAATALIVRRDRLQTMINRLEEQYDLESREEERMRMERIIEEKRFALHLIQNQLILDKFR